MKAKGEEAGEPFSQLDREREKARKKNRRWRKKKFIQGGQKDQPKKETEKGLPPPPPPSLTEWPNRAAAYYIHSTGV